jgi:hypothetical protein
MAPGDQIADYEEAAVDAAKTAIIELCGLLGAYRAQVVLIGGWVPVLLLRAEPDPRQRHPGSLDVDLALDHRTLEGAGYETIGKLLADAGYVRSEKQPFQYFRDIGGIVVRVDLLAGQYGGTGRSRRTQKVQDVQPRKARGCDLVFEISPVEVRLEGSLPSGARDAVRVPIASVVPFLTMKSICMSERRKSKDPFDIWFVLSNHAGGIDALAQAFRPHLHHGLVREAMAILGEKFASIDHVGPTSVAQFDEGLSPEEKTARQRDAFERVQALLRLLSI